MSAPFWSSCCNGAGGPTAATRGLVRIIRRWVLVSLAAGIGGTALATVPANDSFSNATPIPDAGGTLTGTSVEATRETGEYAHLTYATGHSVWWKWTASAVSTPTAVTVDTAGSNFDTVLAVYTGTSVNALTPILDNDDAGDTFDNTSKLAFAAVPGTTYMIAVDGYNNETGSIKITLAIGGTPPENDAFANATTIPAVGGVFTGTSVDSTREFGEPDHAGAEGLHSVWWKWTPPESGTVTIETTGSDFDTILGVYTGTGVNQLAVQASNDDADTGIKTSSVTFVVAGGTTYYIGVDGFEAGSGNVQLTVAETNGIAPANDNLANANAIPTDGGSVSGSNVLATSEVNEPMHANTPGGVSVWWKWTASETGPVSIVTAGSAIDTILAVYTGDNFGAGFTEIASNDDISVGSTSRVDFQAVTGTTYKIAVDGWQGDTGTIELTVAYVRSPPGPVVAVAASAVNSTQFVANWTSVQGAAGYRLDVSTSTAFTTLLPGFNDLDVGTATTRTVPGLAPGTTYYYRVRAYNQYGSGLSSQIITAATSTTAFKGLTNLSVRANAGAGENTLILGFAIVGSGNKTLIIRGIGPKLGDFGIANRVLDPSIDLYRGETIVNQNNDWSSELAGDFVTVGAFALPPGSKDAAMKVSLATGNYTVHLRNSGSLAQGMIEVYDLSKGSTSRLVNLSCRLNVGTGQTIIAGAYLENTTTALLMRNVGPSLSQWLSNYLPDPDLRVYLGSTEAGYNDDWDVALRPYFVTSGAFDLVTGSKDAVIRKSITPGLFTVHATGKGGTGVTLLEIYESPD